MKILNQFKLELDGRSINEGFARVAVSGFVSQLDPTVDEISDIKTAVSEAVTNAIVHGYKDVVGKIYITVAIGEDNLVIVKIRDKGCGISDISKAMEPLFTTCDTGERSGLGFSVMESMMDKIQVRSKVGTGTTITLHKTIRSKTQSR